MKANEGSNDRILRVMLGIGILPLAFVGPQSLWALVGLVPLLTGLFGFCPLYSLLKINTCSISKK